MNWRETILKFVGPGLFGGVTLEIWMRMLRENRFKVFPLFWPRALGITLGAVSNSITRVWEDQHFGPAVAATPIPPPLFVLGIWRSGTTHLHNLLSHDPRFGFPNLYQTFYPHTFLTTEQRIAPMMRWMMPPRRPQDNMGLAPEDPQEDEIALVSLIGRSMMVNFSFPGRRDIYDRYVTLRGLSPGELTEWKAALLGFVRKVVYKTGKPLVLKSPAHTARIKILLELFPGAKFVHIRRNPLDVFQSMRKTVFKLGPMWALQAGKADDLDDRLIDQYNEVYDAYFEERPLIPAGALHEIPFEKLESDPMGELRRMYESLSLPDFSAAEPPLRKYVDSLSGYRKNEFQPLAPEIEARLRREWKRCFECWGY